MNKNTSQTLDRLIALLVLLIGVAMLVVFHATGTDQTVGMVLTIAGAWSVLGSNAVTEAEKVAAGLAALNAYSSGSLRLLPPSTSIDSSPPGTSTQPQAGSDYTRQAS